MTQRIPKTLLAAGICYAALSQPGAAGADPTSRPEPTTFRQWRTSEWVFTAREAPATQPIAVDFGVLFTGPQGERLAVPGFWDGGNTWRVRFTPPTAGPWQYLIGCCDLPDLQGRAGRFAAAPAEGDNPFHRHGGFLRVSENKRYLTYSDGTPFFWLGDTSWFCPSERTPIDRSAGGEEGQKSPPMFHSLIERRRSQGFSVLQIAFLGPNREKLNTLRPRTWKAEQLSFWRRADEYIATANAAGILPAIGVSWSLPASQRPAEDLRLLWRFLIARYGASPVTWLVCGEYNQFNKPEQVAAMLALGRYVKETDPYRRAMSIHPWYFKEEKRQVWAEPWCDFIMIQGGHNCNPPPSVYLDACRVPTTRPVLESECNYEGIGGMKADAVRWAAYRAIQNGSFGYTYGAHGLWNANLNPKADEWGPATRWQDALDRPGGQQMKFLRACYESVPWWILEPRPDAVKLAPSTQPEAAKPSADVHTKADGSRTFLVYFDRKLDPTRPATLTGCGKAVYGAEWFNPRDGKVAPAGELRPVDGATALPARPDAEDWMLILRAKTDR